MKVDKQIVPKVSIIIPVYNVETYIEECLYSVIDQTCKSGLECILVDDCGIDNSVSIAEQFIRQYKGPISFSLLHHERNKGLSAARNTGIREAKGEYVYFLDSDDKLYPDSMLDLLFVANRYLDAEVIQGCTYPGFILSIEKFPDYSNDVEWIRHGLCTISIPDPAWNKLIKRDFVLKNNLFFAEGYLQEDTIWSYQIQKYISSIAFCFETTYWYRYNPNGIMNGMGAMREAKSFARVFNYAYDDLINGEKIEPYEIQYLIWCAKRVFGYIGKQEGNKLLASQNNPLFNKALKWSSGLSRVHSERIRKILLVTIKVCIFDPTIKRLCNKENLAKNYKSVEIS